MIDHFSLFLLNLALKLTLATLCFFFTSFRFDIKLLENSYSLLFLIEMVDNLIQNVSLFQKKKDNGQVN